MYAEYYGLKAMPFQLTPDCQFFFDSREHSRAFAHLAYGLEQGEGFIVITGEIGAGKTMLVEQLWSQLDPNKFVAARVLTTQVSGDDLLRLVARGFGLAEAADKAALLQRLEQLFADTYEVEKRCLLVIDEVQNLPVPALEELRMLSNITVVGRAPFQCLLLGQPQFRHMLADKQLEQLQQRVLASYHLGPLTGSETRDYVQHRLTTAGWAGNPSFEDTAFVAIHRHSAGIPRKINTLCSRVLLAAYLDEAHHISERMVNDVAEELHRDLAAGRPGSERRPIGRDGAFQSVDGRLLALERNVTRHDRVIKRALEILTRMIEVGI